MPLDPELIPVLQGYEELGLPDLAHAEPEDFRSTMTAVPLEQPTTVAGVANRTIPGGDGQDLALRIYTPETDTCASLTLFFHGGGWVIGDLEIHDEFCRRLCIGSGSIIVAVDYSLAPEHKFPSGLEDCYAATAWASGNASGLGAEGGIIIVAGDSAGGNLAAAVCLLARDRAGPEISHQLLIYPATNHDFSTASYHENSDGYFLTKEMMRWFWAHYLHSETELDDPLVSPLLANLTALPTATILTAEYDPLRDDGIAYAEALKAAGVGVEHRLFPGMIHGFVTMPLGLTQTALALDYICARIKSIERH